MEILDHRSGTFESEPFTLQNYFSMDIQPYTAIVRFDSSEAIFHEGEHPSKLYFLLDGRVKLYLTHANGKISIIDFLSAPCFIGEMELLDMKKETNGVTAITPCTCYAIDLFQCRNAILQDVKFLQHLCHFLSTKAIHNTAHYSRNLAYPLNVRLAEFILMTSYHGMYREKHSEVAEFLGVSYRNLLYVLAEFVKSGILEHTKQGYQIRDYDALKNIADTATV